ncbi:NADPH-dependent FMN reductase [Algibacillus agarilyticus]|uniref:NADPH-dependent FMN reductase n=1 Tax=Algibacillus agarilyticus TaxID=2234133 RepID=UPI000DD03193|nr:NAD(P)H-dependent oxidoreductase [Algibacillus agarilyticus]
MKIVAFAASNSKQSINKQLARYTANLVPNAQVNVLDLNDYEMPIYSSDRETESGIPAQAVDFFNTLGEADAIVISFAEHNGTYTAAYKNLFDWTSRHERNFFQNKPVIMLATSPGPGGAVNVLKTATTSLPYFGGVLKGELSVPSYYDNVDAQTHAVTNADINAQLHALVEQLSR